MSVLHWREKGQANKKIISFYYKTAIILFKAEESSLIPKLIS